MSGAEDPLALLAAMAGGQSGTERDRQRKANDPRNRTAEQRAAAAKVAAEKMNKLKASTKGSASDDTMCSVCQKTVYAAERRDVEIGGATDHYHESCFKCSDCGVQLKISTYVSVSRKIYCQSHAKDHSADAGNAAKERVSNLSKSSHADDAKVLAREEKERQERERRQADVAARLRSEAGTGTTGACRHCGKPVYQAESLSVQVKTYEEAWEFHKTCFRCKTCNLQLNLRNYQSIDGVLYCDAHVKEAGPKMALSENSYFVSPLKDDDYVKPEDSNPSEAAPRPVARSDSKVADLTDATHVPAVSRGSSIRILESAEEAIAAARARDLKVTHSVEVSEEDNSAEAREARRLERRKALEAQLAAEEAEYEKRRAERRSRRSESGTTDEADTSSRSSKKDDPDDAMADFEKRKAERRARLEAVRNA